MLDRGTAAIAVLVVGVIGVLTGPTEAGTSPSAAANGVADRSSAQGRIIVKGVARRRNGSILKGGRISVHPLRSSRRPALVGGGRTDRRGRFSIKIQRTSGLGRYAARHNGRLNLVLWVYKGRRVHLRAVQVPYRRDGKRPARDTYVLGPTRLLASQRLSRRHAKAVDNTAVDVSRWATIGRITATRDVTTSLRYFQNIETSASIGVLVGDSVTMSGSMQLGESNGAGVGATLRAKRFREAIQIELD
jgi:hypothetical protein